MKTKLLCTVLVVCLCFSFIGCNKNDKSDSKAEVPTVTEFKEPKIESKMTQEEKDSIKVGKLSKEHEFYKEVVGIDPECADYITEISIFDKEIKDTFVVHVSLPPNFDKNKKYPLVLMTDGVWRLSDHPQLHAAMKNKEIEDVILVSVGYPNGYDYTNIRVRDLVTNPDNYLHFICDNLMPYLVEQYPVDTMQLTLAGHSYGGYWTFFSLLHSDTISKNMFKNYYIGSPSVQASTNGNDLNYFRDEFLKNNKTINCNVYVCVGDREEEAFKYMIGQYVEDFQACKFKGLNLKYEVIPENDHNTVFKPSIKIALKMFYGKK